MRMGDRTCALEMTLCLGQRLLHNAVEGQNTLDSKDVCEPRSAIISEGAEDEVLALLIEYQDSRQHREWRGVGRVCCEERSAAFDL